MTKQFMMEQFDKLKRDIEDALQMVTEGNALEQLRIEFLGRKGKVADLMKQMATLTEEQRKVVGRAANEVKSAMEAAFIRGPSLSASPGTSMRVTLAFWVL